MEKELRASEVAMEKLNEEVDQTRGHRGTCMSYERFRHSPAKMAYYTGLPDGQTFEYLFEFLKASQDTILSCRQVQPENRRRSAGGGGKKEGLLSVREQLLFITLVRLRRGVDEEFLTDVLYISQSTVSWLLSTWINFLYLRLSSIPIWPSPHAVEHYLPTVFKAQYPNTFIIIDCSEIRCEVPSSLPLQSQLYSSYKSHTTLKGLLGITPCGAVSFLSEFFTGSIIDGEIFKESVLLDMLRTLPPGKSIMADKSFDVEDLLAPTGLHVNIPPLKGA